MNKSKITSRGQTQRSRERMDQIVAYIITFGKETYADLNIETVSREFRIDRHKLDRLFRDHLAITPEAFIHRQKMTAAARAILSGEMNLSVLDLARKFGYKKKDSFEKCFKAFMAVGPGDLISIERKRRQRQNSGTGNIFNAGYTVSHLANVNNFLLDFACIIDEDNSFRLVVYDRQENYYIDRYYKTPGIAKKRFRSMYAHKFTFGKYFTCWTPFYYPVKAWINSRNDILKSVPLKTKFKQHKNDPPEHKRTA